MTTETVYTTLGRDELMTFLRSIPARLLGRVSDPHRFASGLTARIGQAWYQLVQESFDTKGKGGTDKAGDTWPPNTPEYLAYQKGRMKHWKKPDSFREKRRSHLTAKQFTAWTKANSAALKKIEDDVLKGLVLRMPYRQAKARASAAAWAATRKAGAATLLESYGTMPDQVLVDHGDLRRTILPGELIETAGVAAEYQPSDADQIFEASSTQVIMGSRNPTADYHHNSKKLRHGDGQKGTVRRRLWPENIPDTWWDDILQSVLSGMTRMAQIIRAGDIK